MNLQNLENKKIILGITGGIAAYKSCEIIRLLKTNGAIVKVVSTKSALEFITPLTLRTLSDNPVHCEMFQQNIEEGVSIKHISLAKWADAILIAPASANTIAKLANGFACDLLASVCLASSAPIAIAPAMNEGMWQNPITQENIKKLEDKKFKVFGPVVGNLACGDVGCGKMLESNELVKLTASIFKAPILKGKTILVTSGPTVEPIDPVRYISNYSSGKMGFAIAKAAADFGAKVYLVSGQSHLTTPKGAERINVLTAAEMLNAVMAKVSACDIFIGAAAVADYKVAQKSSSKIKKTRKALQLSLVENPDILSLVAKQKPSLFTVGFAAETEDVTKNAKKKLQSKGIDMVVANEVGSSGKGFNSDENALTVITKAEMVELPYQDKLLLAYELLELIAKNLGGHTKTRT